MPSTSPFSVGSLLNASRSDGTRLTPASSVVTDSSDAEGPAGASCSSTGSPLAALLRGRLASPRAGLLAVSSACAQQQPHRVTKPAALILPPADAQAAHCHTPSSHLPYGPPPPAVDIPPPMPPPGPYHPPPADAYAAIYWQRHPQARHQYHHHHQLEHHLRHGPMHPHQTAGHRYWPYPQPPHYLAQLAPPQPAPYYMHPGAPPPPPPVPPPYPASSGPCIPWRRERRSKACLRCHTKKIKCEGEGPTCDGCKLAGSECRWVEMKKRGPKPKRDQIVQPETEAAAAQDVDVLVNTPDPPDTAVPRPETPSHPHATAAVIAEPPAVTAAIGAADDGAAADTDAEAPAVTAKTATMEQVLQRFHSDQVPGDVREAVVCFLDHLYAQLPVFHPATLVRRIAFGQIEALLVDALRLCTARISARQPGFATDVGALTERVHKRLLAGVEQPSLDYVRAVLLTASALEGDAQFLMYSSLAGLAASTAMRLGWHTLDLGRSIDEVPWDDWVELEEKRRTFWSVYQLDSHHSLLSDRPMTIAKTHIFISTPGSDNMWDDVTMPQIMHWPTRHQPDIRRDVVVRMGALSYAFIEHCNLAALVAQLAEFLWEARVDVYAPPGDGGWSSEIPFMPPIHALSLGASSRPVRSLADYPEFRQIHDALFEWRAGLIPAEDMRGEAGLPVTVVEHTGALENRRFAMRLRYFTLRCQFTSALHLLHLANRPSFVDPERQPRRKFGRVAAFDAVAASGDEQALRKTMATALAELHNDGLVACDVADESWAVCLHESHALLDHLDRNGDIPAERMDAAVALSMFTSCTVFLRHIRMCRTRISRGAVGSDASVPGADPAHQLAALHDDAARAVAALRRMWTALQTVSRVWGIRDAVDMLQAMHIDEVASATSQ
ncbi:hypothetical protein H4R19_001222 [Coemansia spiralis]|nr:hypothetical protein H4R19_001222 [Coemansia spiralis]